MSDDTTRWHRQALTGGWDCPPEQRGDCFPCCITSILGLPPDAIANIHAEDHWDRYQAECARYGYMLVELDIAVEPPPGYWIATLPSPLPAAADGEPALHSVVAKGYELVHDPARKRRYDAHTWTEAWSADRIVGGRALAPLDPAGAFS